MKKLLLACCLALYASIGAAAENPRVQLNTSMGVIVLELYPDKSPRSVANFLQYVKDGHYNGVLFHRVIDGFMIQTGGFDKGFQQKPTRPTIQNEADNGLTNDKYTVAMARTPGAHTASAQFFINTADNAFLNFRARTDREYGYAVFGKVVSGTEVVDKIAKVKTGRAGSNADVPLEPVTVDSVTLLPSQQ